MHSFYPYTFFSHSFPYFVEVDPKVLALPKEGMAEYAALAEAFNRVTSTLLEIVEQLHEFKSVDPARADYYNDMIEERLHKAHINMMEWEITRRRILINWLRNS